MSKEHKVMFFSITDNTEEENGRKVVKVEENYKKEKNKVLMEILQERKDKYLC